MPVQNTRTRYYPGFGTALEVQSKSDPSRWFHVRWLSGPVWSYQEKMRRMIRQKAQEATEA